MVCEKAQPRHIRFLEEKKNEWDDLNIEVLGMPTTSANTGHSEQAKQRQAIHVG